MAVQGKDDPKKNAGFGSNQQSQQQTATGAAFERAREQQSNQNENMNTNFGNNTSGGDDGMWSFLNPSANGLYTVTDTAAGEALSKLDKALGEIYKSANPAIEITTLPLSMEANQMLNIDTLVVITRLTNVPQIGIAYHPILIAGSIPKIDDAVVQVNGQNTNETRVEGDVADDVFHEAVFNEVRRLFPNDQITITLAEVLPRTFNFEDKDAVQKVARNASMAGAVTLQKLVPGWSDLNLANVKKDSSLTLRSNYGQPNENNRVGLPVRSDVVVSLTAEPLNQNQGQQRRSVVQTRSREVSRVQAFVDLVWAPTTGPRNPFFNAQMNQAPAFGQAVQQQNPHQRYIPRIVVTGLSTQNPPTTAMQLLSALLSSYISEEGHWVHAFQPRTYRSGSKEIDMHDIGALAIEANFENDPSGLGQRVDTSLETFQPMLADYLAAIIRPDPIISVDVDECGPDSWYNGFLPMAAEGQQEALDELFNAWNILTNGRFAINWEKAQYNGPICTDENNRIHLGYYLDAEGNRRDLREIDYLAVLNRFGGGTDHDIVKRWSDSFIDGTDPLLKRLENRKKIIDMMTQNTAVYTGFARRISFAHVLMQVGARSAKEAGLDFRTISSHAQLKTNERASGNFDNLMMSGGQTSGLFARSSFGQNTNNFGSNRSFGFSRSGF